MISRAYLVSLRCSVLSLGGNVVFRLVLRAVLVCEVACVFVGCGHSEPDGSQFRHDEAARLFLEAMKVRPTDQAKALELLTQSIEARPSYNAYYQRAWIYGLHNRDDEAKADISSGLELEPENRELKWLQGELKKPTSQRRLDSPPTQAK
jgi:tetratricopeptide (TPR) repeat protein